MVRGREVCKWELLTHASEVLTKAFTPYLLNPKMELLLLLLNCIRNGIVVKVLPTVSI